ncbi:MAG: hypothetical protein ACTSU5_06390 [Promethearchaeota archaeon]
MHRSIPSDDELKLNKLERGITNQIRSLFNADHSVASELELFVKRLKVQVDQKAKLIAKMKEVAALMERITTDPSAKIKRVDADRYSRQITAFETLLENGRDFLSGFQNVSAAYKNFLGSKSAYLDAYDEYSRTLGTYQKTVYKYQKMSNRLQTDEKFRRVEESLRGLESQVERVKRERESRFQLLRQAGRDLDRAWQDLKPYLKDCAF